MAERWVCLDIGETLVDETRVWSTWARVLGTSPLTLMAALGASVAAGGSYPEALARFHPDPMSLHDRYDAALGPLRAEDLYADAVPTITALRGQGLNVAVIGNQPARRTAELRALGIQPDVMAMSEEIGASKPDRPFFSAALVAMGDPDPSRVVYVGDRVDNDVIAARAAGLKAVHLRRGPWSVLGPQADGRADAVVEDLEALVHSEVLRID